MYRIECTLIGKKRHIRLLKVQVFPFLMDESKCVNLSKCHISVKCINLCCWIFYKFFKFMRIYTNSSF